MNSRDTNDFIFPQFWKSPLEDLPVDEPPFQNDNLFEFQNLSSPLVSYNNTETYGGLECKSTFEGVELELENGLAIILEALDNERNSKHNSLGQSEETGSGSKKKEDPIEACKKFDKSSPINEAPKSDDETLISGESKGISISEGTSLQPVVPSKSTRRTSRRSNATSTQSETVRRSPRIANLSLRGQASQGTYEASRN